jgi:hypothetical protein
LSSSMSSSGTALRERKEGRCGHNENHFTPFSSSRC